MGSFQQWHNTRKRNKRCLHQNKRKYSGFADEILYTENHKDFTKKLRERIKEFSKVAGYKINTQKSFAFCTLITNH